MGSCLSLLFFVSRIRMMRDDMFTSLLTILQASPILIPVEYSSLRSTGMEKTLHLNVRLRNISSSAVSNILLSSSSEKIYGTYKFLGLRG